MVEVAWNPRQLRQHLSRGAPVYLPVNPVEYHGPHLTLLNDHLVSVGLAHAMHEALQSTLGEHPLLLAPELGVGVEPCPGPGSCATPYGVVRRQVIDAVERLADLGAQRVVLLTFHGSPLHSHALQAGVRALEARGVRAIAPLSLALEQQLRGDFEAVESAWMPIEDEVARAALRAEAQSDFHAGFIETSIALHFAPEHVQGHREVTPCPPPAPLAVPRSLAGLARALGLRDLSDELELVGRGLGWYAMRPFPGYSGRPDLANPDSGAVFAGAMVEAFTRRAVEVFEGRSAAPAPPMPWMPWLSLGGRVGGVHIGLEHMLPAPEPQESGA